MRPDIGDAFPQVANAEEILDLRAGCPRLLHHLQRLPVGALRVSGGQSRDQSRRNEKAGRVGGERQVPADHGERDAAEGRTDGQRRGPQRVLQRGRKRIVGFGDEVRQHRLLSRLEERAHQRVRGDDRVRDPCLLRTADEQQAEHETRAQNVAHDHDRAPREPIRDDARCRPGEKHRDEPGE